MARRTGRPDFPNNPVATLRALSMCRLAMIDVLRVVKPMGPAYHAASMVVAAIDGFATFLTGERYHFSAGGSTPIAPQRGTAAPTGTEDVQPPSE